MNHVGIGHEVPIDLVINRLGTLQAVLRERMLLRHDPRTKEPAS